jgi:hypothetical protein
VGLSPAERQRRSRAHKKGDHSLCDPQRCVDVTRAVTQVAEPAVTEPVTDPVLEQLGARGHRLYREALAEHPDLGPRQRVVLEEAARTADRLEQLDRLLRGDDRVWAHVEIPDGGPMQLLIDKPVAEARAQQASLARLLGELRHSLAPAESTPSVPAAPTAAPAGPQAGGGKLVDLRARIAAARAATQG